MRPGALWEPEGGSYLSESGPRKQQVSTSVEEPSRDGLTEALCSLSCFLKACILNSSLFVLADFLLRSRVR